MTPKELGDQPAYPQSPCGQCAGLGRKIEYDVYDDDDKDIGECSVCHGTGLIGGGMTKREALVVAVIQGYSADANRRLLPKDMAEDALSIADAVLAELCKEVGK